MLTRKEMEKVIREGGSVLYRETILTRVGELPSDAELAKGDSEREASAREEILLKMAELESELAYLGDDGETKESEKSEVKAPVKSEDDAGDGDDSEKESPKTKKKS